MFVAIGHDPNTALFRGQLDLDDDGYIITATQLHPHVRGRRVRGGDVRTTCTAGDHRGGQRLHGGDRSRALASGQAHAATSREPTGMSEVTRRFVLCRSVDSPDQERTPVADES